MKRYILSAIAAGVLLTAPTYAQTPAPGSTSAEAEHHAARVENQMDRIQQGQQSGALTDRQADRLTRQEARINREAKRMAAKNGGQLSQRQEKRIHRQMNRESRRIYRAKH
jgi:hypothetical protein